MRLHNGEPHHLVVFLNGASRMLVVHNDVHTREPYVYAKNVNGIYVRVYVEPGDSVEFIERESGDPYRSALEHTLAA